MESPMIYGAIVDAMGQINAISKDRRNSTQGFQYRGIDDVMNELHGVLAKCGIFIVPTVLEEQRSEGKTSKGGILYYTRLKIKFTYYAKDGSFIESVVIGEAMDSGDKASNKALSVGMKYSLLQVFCIPTEESKDPDENSYEFVQDNKTVTQNQQTTSQVDPSTIRAKQERLELKSIIEKYEKPLSSSKTKPTPFDMCCEALAENDPDRICEMLGRVKSFLGKMGISV